MLIRLAKEPTQRLRSLQLIRCLANANPCQKPPPSYDGGSQSTGGTSQSAGGPPTDGGSSDNQQRQRPEFPGQVRLGFIPEEWFQLFYNKTGVTGPYMFGVGLLTLLCSKEYYVMEHEYYSGLSLAIMAAVAVKKLGPALAKWLDKEVDKIEEEWKAGREAELKSIQDEIEAEKLEQWRAEGALMLMDVKRENIDLQIEATYREAAMECYKQIIQRLDHQVACANVQTRMNQKNMVHWITSQVVDELTSKGDGEVLDKTIADLSAMAVRAKL